MAKLGSAVTNKFIIGCAELRVGPLSKANQLSQAFSVGLIDEAAFTVSNESVDLEGGCPKTIVATAITTQSSSITATLREYSHRNLKMMVGEGVALTVPADFETAMAGADVVLGATAFDVTDASGFSDGDVVVIYPEGRPEDVTVSQIDTIAGTTLTLKTGQGTVVPYPVTTEATTAFKVFLGSPISIGAIEKTNYFSVMLIGQENESGRPSPVSFWKGSISSDLTVTTNADDFSSADLEIKCLTPSISEYATGGDLFHVADLIPKHPTGMLAFGN
jgi:hypothetical protein